MKGDQKKPEADGKANVKAKEKHTLYTLLCRNR